MLAAIPIRQTGRRREGGVPDAKESFRRRGWRRLGQLDRVRCSSGVARSLWRTFGGSMIRRKGGKGIVVRTSTCGIVVILGDRMVGLSMSFLLETVRMIVGLYRRLSKDSLRHLSRES